MFIFAPTYGELIMKDKVWVQAAIDVENLDVAKRIAWMALDNGAEWLEIGTPLLYKFGCSVIGEIRKIVGKNVVLVADYKCPYAGLVAQHSSEQGANYVLLTAGYNDCLIRYNLDECRKWGIQPIFDLNVKPCDVTNRVKQISKLGVEFVFTHHYDEIVDDDGVVRKYDNLHQILNACTSVKVGITSDDFEEAKHAVNNGADWMIFGCVLRQPNPRECKRWIDMLHGAI